MVEFRKENASKLDEEPYLNLKEGYNAVYVPVVHSRCILPENEVLETIESFLNEIGKQGGEIIGVMPIIVAAEPKHEWLVEHVPLERYVLIVKK